mmetsp:Transcript_48413/g.141114  ORF Transcript_48413/g.141114 Transcript_48413/m.141114 type:complete len:84 (-) Transcript_48413:7-258(-)
MPAFDATMVGVLAACHVRNSTGRALCTGYRYAIAKLACRIFGRRGPGVALATAAGLGGAYSEEAGDTCPNSVAGSRIALVVVA